MDWISNRVGQSAGHMSDNSISQVLSISIKRFVVLFLALNAALMFFVGKKGGDDQADRRLLEALEEADLIAEGINSDYLFSLATQLLVTGQEDDSEEKIDDFLAQHVYGYLHLDIILVVDEKNTIIHSSDERLIGKEISIQGRENGWLQEVFKDSNELNYLDLQVLNIKPVEEVFGPEAFDYIGCCFQDDNIFGKKGSIMLLGSDSATSRSWHKESLEGYIQYAHAGSGGFFLLLKKDGEQSGTYNIVGGKDVLPRIYKTTGHAVETVLFPEDKYNPYESFSWKYREELYRCMYKNVDGDLLIALFPEGGVVTVISIYIFIIILFLALLFILFGIALRRMVGGLIEKPVQKLNESLMLISAGNLEVTANVRDNLEFSMLTDEINIMVLSLKRYIREAAARVDRELAIARSIQLSSVPSIFPAFSNRTDFDIYASMEPAREVGGDFYDFFLVDEDHLALVMADVSDKGIPAAMFMMRAKAKIHDRAKRGGTPAQILYDSNNSLSKNNKERIFVTVWLAIIELSTGRGLEANAGHEHPAFYKNESYRLVKYPHSPPLGAMPKLQFTDREFTLESGDRIFVYTDGVTDAANKENKRFGESALIEALNELSDREPKDLIEGIKSRIDSFAVDATQFDDITMCAFTYLGKKKDEAKKD